jgi:hypothetical protein
VSEPAGVPKYREFAPTMKIDVHVGDWRSELEPELSSEQKERALYEKAWEAYLEGDYGFGLWCWFECDRLTNALRGSVREVTRVLGEGRYLGFSHRRAIAEKVPLEKVWRPRKGDMSTPRTDATMLATYQLLCVYAIRAKAGDPKAKAELAIALLEHDERRRADPFYAHFETFQRLLDRATAAGAAEPSPGSAPSTAAPATGPTPSAPSPASPAPRSKGRSKSS